MKRLVVLVALGCHAARPVVPGHRAAVRIGDPTWNASCAGDVSECVAELPVVVDNRSSSTIVIGAIEVMRANDLPNGRRTRFELRAPVRIDAHSSFQHEIRVRDTESSLIVEPIVFAPTGAQLRVRSAPFVLANPTRVAAKTACLAADGVFGPQGLGDRLACNPRTRDAGRVCRDGDLCEGLCIFEHNEPVASTTSARLGRAVGRCSEYVWATGCVQYIARGATVVPMSSPPLEMCE